MILLQNMHNHRCTTKQKKNTQETKQQKYLKKKKKKQSKTSKTNTPFKKTPKV